MPSFLQRLRASSSAPSSPMQQQEEHPGSVPIVPAAVHGTFSVKVIAFGQTLAIPVTKSTTMKMVLRNVMETAVSEKQAMELGNIDATLYYKEKPLPLTMLMKAIPRNAVLHLHTSVAATSSVVRDQRHSVASVLSQQRPRNSTSTITMQPCIRSKSMTHASAGLVAVLPEESRSAERQPSLALPRPGSFTEPAQLEMDRLSAAPISPNAPGGMWRTPVILPRQYAAKFSGSLSESNPPFYYIIPREAVGGSLRAPTHLHNVPPPTLSIPAAKRGSRFSSVVEVAPHGYRFPPSTPSLETAALGGGYADLHTPSPFPYTPINSTAHGQAMSDDTHLVVYVSLPCETAMADVTSSTLSVDGSNVREALGANEALAATPVSGTTSKAATPKSRSSATYSYRRLRVPRDYPVGTLRELCAVGADYRLHFSPTAVEDERKTFRELGVPPNAVLYFHKAPVFQQAEFSSAEATPQLQPHHSHSESETSTISVHDITGVPYEDSNSNASHDVEPVQPNAAAAAAAAAHSADASPEQRFMDRCGSTSPPAVMPGIAYPTLPLPQLGAAAGTPVSGLCDQVRSEGEVKEAVPPPQLSDPPARSGLRENDLSPAPLHGEEFVAIRERPLTETPKRKRTFSLVAKLRGMRAHGATSTVTPEAFPAPVAAAEALHGQQTDVSCTSLGVGTASSTRNPRGAPTMGEGGAQRTPLSALNINTAEVLGMRPSSRPLSKPLEKKAQGYTAKPPSPHGVPSQHQAAPQPHQNGVDFNSASVRAKESAIKPSSPHPAATTTVSEVRVALGSDAEPRPSNKSGPSSPAAGLAPPETVRRASLTRHSSDSAMERAVTSAAPVELATYAKDKGVAQLHQECTGGTPSESLPVDFLGALPGPAITRPAFAPAPTVQKKICTEDHSKTWSPAVLGFTCAPSSRKAFTPESILVASSTRTVVRHPSNDSDVVYRSMSSPTAVMPHPLESDVADYLVETPYNHCCIRITIRDPLDATRYHYGVPVEPNCPVGKLREWLKEIYLQSGKDKETQLDLCDATRYGVFVDQRLLPDADHVTFAEATGGRHDSVFSIAER